jgi:hypothetical protein
MKKLATLITASLIGLTSVASADSSIDFSATASVSFGTSASTGSVLVRDHRTPPPAHVKPIRLPIARFKWRPIKVRPQLPPPSPVIVLPSPWTELGVVGTGKQSLNHAVFEGTRLDSLMLELKGNVDLKQVLIVYENDQEQRVRFDDVDGARRFIDLAGADRAIHHVIVYSKGSGDIRVLGRNDANRTMPEPLTKWSKLGVVATGKQVLKIDSNRKFDLLALSISGSVHLNKLLINYANGDSQVVAYDELLTAKHRMPMIDLAGTDRQINGIIVYTDADTRGEVTLYAL